MSFEKIGKVLVTGATGFLGGALVRKLCKHGVSVVAHGRNEMSLAALQHLGASTIAWDLRDPIPTESRTKLEGVKAIVHAAALSSPFGWKNDFNWANVIGTDNLLDLAKTLDLQRFVYISSPSVYFALKDQLDVSEDSTLPRPFNHYAWSKAEAEKRVLQHPKIGPVILRPRGIYGPGESTLLPRLLAAARSQALPRFRGGVARIDLTFIDDVVEAIVAALSASAIVHNRVYNVSGGQPLAVSSIVEQCCAKAGVHVRWKKMRLKPALAVAYATEKLALFRTGKEPAITRYGLALFAFQQSLNIHAARTDLGWMPKVLFDEGLERTFGAANL